MFPLSMHEKRDANGFFQSPFLIASFEEVASVFLDESSFFCLQFIDEGKYSFVEFDVLKKYDRYVAQCENDPG